MTSFPRPFKIGNVAGIWPFWLAVVPFGSLNASCHAFQDLSVWQETCEFSAVCPLWMSAGFSFAAFNSFLCFLVLEISLLTYLVGREGIHVAGVWRGWKTTVWSRFSPPPLCGFWGLNSGCQTSLASAPPGELSHWPLFLCFAFCLLDYSVSWVVLLWPCGFEVLNASCVCLFVSSSALEFFFL